MEEPSADRKFEERYLTVDEWLAEVAVRFGEVAIVIRGQRKTAIKNGDVVAVWEPGSAD